MRREHVMALFLAVVAAAWAPPPATGALGKSAAGAPGKSAAPAFTSVTLVVRHRVFPNFIDRQAVKLNKAFIVGDTEYSARVVQYVPDFFMDVNSRKIGTRSNEPKNPAFQIIVRQGKVPQDTAWAFLRAPPHFTRNSMLAFQVQRIDFPDRPAIVNTDSTTHAVQPHASPEAAAHPPATHPATPGLTTQPSHGTKPGTPGH